MTAFSSRPNHLAEQGPVKLGDILKSITQTRQYAYNPSVEKVCNPYVLTDCLANNRGAIGFCEELNKFPDITPRQAYDYYYYSFRAGLGFSKFITAKKDDDIIPMISERFQCNRQRAIEYNRLLTDEQRLQIKQSYFQGGQNARLPRK